MSGAPELEEHLRACADEHIARAYGGDPWWRTPDGEYFDVDEDVTEGPVELVRRSDGARFSVDVSVSVWQKTDV